MRSGGTEPHVAMISKPKSRNLSFVWLPPLKVCQGSAP